MLFLKRELLRIQIVEADHDLLSKHAYVAVRWARGKGGSEGAVERAIERLKNKFPGMDRDDIEEAAYAMDFNAILEGGS